MTDDSQTQAQWWADFDQLTEAGTRPHLFRGALTDEFVQAREIDRVVFQMRRETERPRRLRIYTGAERRDDLAADFLAGSSTGDSALAAMQRHFKEQHLCFIINDFQDWSQPIAAAAADFLQGMYERSGMPPGGVELIVFAGNYTGTPFGAHRGFEHAFLAHLGPAHKRFFLWEPSSWVELTGSLDSVADYQPLLARATTALVLHPGDLLYLPEQWFHIGLTDQYCCSVAMGLLQPAADNLLRILLDATPQGSDRLPYLKPSGSNNPVEPLVQDALRRRLSRLIPDFTEDLWFRRLSNGGLVCKHNQPEDPLSIQPRSVLRVRPPARLCIVPETGSADHVRIYARHQVMRVRKHEQLFAIAEQLNSGHAVPVSAIIQALGPRWSAPATLGFLRALSRLGCLDLAEPASLRTGPD